MQKNKYEVLSELLDEYNKYLISRIINKSYNFEVLRNLAKQLSDTSFNIKANGTNEELLESIKRFNNKIEKEKEQQNEK